MVDYWNEVKDIKKIVVNLLRSNAHSEFFFITLCGSAMRESGYKLHIYLEKKILLARLSRTQVLYLLQKILHTT